MPAAIGIAIQAIMALVAAFPQIEAIAMQAKAFFSGLFSSGLITKQLQDALHAHVDSIGVLFKMGLPPPPEFQVQPDPVTPPPAP